MDFLEGCILLSDFNANTSFNHHFAAQTDFGMPHAWSFNSELGVVQVSTQPKNEKRFIREEKQAPCPEHFLPLSTSLRNGSSRAGIAGRVVPVDEGEVIQENIDRPDVPLAISTDSKPNQVGNRCKSIGDLGESADSTGCELDLAQLIAASNDTEITSSYVGLLLAVSPLEGELVGGLSVKESGYLLNGRAAILVGGDETARRGGSSSPC